MLNFSVQTKNTAIDLDTQRLLNRAGRYMVSSSVKKIQNMNSPQNSPLTIEVKRGNKPLRDTGQLMASINHRVEGNRAIISTNRTGARLQNEGGVIRPKKAKKLWVPASRFTRLELRKAGWSITNLLKILKQKGSIYKSRSGKTVFFRKKGSKTVQKLFYLKDSVTIPKRPFFEINEKDQAEIRKILRGIIDES